MSDLFHEQVPTGYVQKVFATMAKADWHQFQVLTKRPERASSIASMLPWPPNVWFGVSVESQRYVGRINTLREIPAAKRFLSLEPLLGPLTSLNLARVDWVIVGGESGPKARPMDGAWVVDIRNQCQKAGVAFFFKQWGSHGPDGKRRSKKTNGRLLDGRTWDEWPSLESSGTAG